MTICFRMADPLDDGAAVVLGPDDFEHDLIGGRAYMIALCSCCNVPAAQRLLTTSDAEWTLLDDAGFIEHVFVEHPSTARQESARVLRPMVACSDACERQILDALGRPDEGIGFATPFDARADADMPLDKRTAECACGRPLPKWSKRYCILCRYLESTALQRARQRAKPRQVSCWYCNATVGASSRKLTAVVRCGDAACIRAGRSESQRRRRRAQKAKDA